ncbi:MAG: TIGR03905 family TSCPD domain-containing protein [Lachnospiraceae bacterium]|nr:TIGR03905 family TSCPD domain-containing protein [Lachnospiraceae bacterium]
MYSYRPQGVCSRKIQFDVEDGLVKNCSFTGGCQGNTQGIARLVEGRPVDEVINLLSGIVCRGSATGSSCPDQLAKALIKSKEVQG